MFQRSKPSNTTTLYDLAAPALGVALSLSALQGERENPKELAADKTETPAARVIEKSADQSEKPEARTTITASLNLPAGYENLVPLTQASVKSAMVELAFAPEDAGLKDEKWEFSEKKSRCTLPSDWQTAGDHQLVALLRSGDIHFIGRVSKEPSKETFVLKTREAGGTAMLPPDQVVGLGFIRESFSAIQSEAQQSFAKLKQENLPRVSFLGHPAGGTQNPRDVEFALPYPTSGDNRAEITPQSLLDKGYEQVILKFEANYCKICLSESLDMSDWIDMGADGKKGKFAVIVVDLSHTDDPQIRKKVEKFHNEHDFPGTAEGWYHIPVEQYLRGSDLTIDDFIRSAFGVAEEQFVLPKAEILNRVESDGNDEQSYLRVENTRPIHLVKQLRKVWKQSTQE